MPISYNNTLTHIHVPRCAGTTISRIIGATAPINLQSQRRVRQLIETGRLTVGDHDLTQSQYTRAICKSPQHLTAYEIQQLFPSCPRPWFAVVRNPFERLVSEYGFCLTQVTWSQDARVIAAKRGFEHFVKWALQMETDMRITLFDGHIETQASFVNNPLTNEPIVDRIFRYENLEECFQFVRTNLSVGANFIPTNQRKTLHASYTSYYSDDLRRTVEEFYKEDLQQFEYQF